MPGSPMSLPLEVLNTGPGYRTLVGAAANETIYRYVNNQDPATLWFHEHTLGATRVNVYAGLAGYYFLRGAMESSVKGGLPSGQQELEFVIQDRQFDTNGQLLFPDGTPPGAGLNGDPPNPDVHPFWNPEFFGNVIVVNGASWPKFTAQPQRYRFRLLNGSNARFYNLSFSNGHDLLCDRHRRRPPG